MRLIAPPGKIVGGSIKFKGEELTGRVGRPNAGDPR